MHSPEHSCGAQTATDQLMAYRQLGKLCMLQWSHRTATVQTLHMHGAVIIIYYTGSLLQRHCVYTPSCQPCWLQWDSADEQLRWRQTGGEKRGPRAACAHGTRTCTCADRNFIVCMIMLHTLVYGALARRSTTARRSGMPDAHTRVGMHAPVPERPAPSIDRRSERKLIPWEKVSQKKWWNFR